MSKTNVLIVEDEGIVAMDIKNQLETLGYNIIAAVPTGEEAIKIAEESHPDVVLMDIQIQGEIDGVETTERIHRLFDIPVIFLTANSDETTLQRAKVTGPFGYLLKPFEERDLHTTIEMALFRHKLERELKENKRWLSITLKCIGDGVITTDAEGYVSYMNPVAEKLTGWKSEQALGKKMMEVFYIINEETRTEIENPATIVLRKGSTISLTNLTVLISRDGNEIPIDDSAAPIIDDNGNIIGVVLVFRDITERRKAEDEIKKYRSHLEKLVEKRTFDLIATNKKLQSEINERKLAAEALRLSEKRFRDIAFSSSDWIWEIDNKGIYTYISENVVNVLGYTPEELIGKTPFDIMAKDEVDKLKEKFIKLAAKKENIVDLVNWNINKNGRLVCLLTNGVPMIDENGNLLGYRGVDKDISERERSEELLKQSEQKYRTLIESMHDGVGIMDLDENIMFANPALCKIFGIELKKLIGMNLKEIVIEQEIDKIHEGTLKSKNKEHGSFELVIKKGDGQLCQILISSTPLLDNNDNVMGSIGIYTDISDLKKAEKDKMELREKLIRAQKMESLGILAGGVAHDLNNILGPLVAYPEFIQMKLPEDSPIRADISKIEQSAQRAAGVVQDLLTMARRGRYEMTPVDVNEVIKSYMQSPDFLELKSRFPDVKIKIDLDGDIPKARGSVIHLSKVIMNLIINAFEAMSEGGELSVKTEYKHIEKLLRGFSDIKADKYVVITIGDTGYGIDCKDIENIFEPFYSKKELGKSGSGLGLAIVHEVIKDHNGYIDISSVVNQGSEFMIYLPMIETVLSENKTSEIVIQGSEKILVVDDIAEQRELTTTMLSRLGYDVEVASGGKEAVEYLKNNHVDVVILDMILEEGFDGLDTYREIIKKHPAQRAIITSGFSETERVKEAKILGVGKYIRKPFNMQVLGLAIKEILANKPDFEKTTKMNTVINSPK